MINTFNLLMVGLLIVNVAFFMGLLPIPIGYERGKVAWVMWCGTGMHAHVVYLTDDDGFQTLHPKDKGEVEEDQA